MTFFKNRTALRKCMCRMALAASRVFLKWTRRWEPLALAATRGTSWWMKAPITKNVTDVMDVLLTLGTVIRLSWVASHGGNVLQWEETKIIINVTMLNNQDRHEDYTDEHKTVGLSCSIFTSKQLSTIIELREWIKWSLSFTRPVLKKCDAWLQRYIQQIYISYDVWFNDTYWHQNRKRPQEGCRDISTGLNNYDCSDWSVQPALFVLPLSRQWGSSITLSVKIFQNLNLQQAVLLANIIR